MPPLMHFTHATWSAPLDEVELLYVASATGFDFGERLAAARAYHGGSDWCGYHGPTGPPLCDAETCKDIYVVELAAYVFHHAYDCDRDCSCGCAGTHDFPPEVLAWERRAAELEFGREVAR